VAPTQWSRYYFPENLHGAGSGQGGTQQKANMMFQHFDVRAVAPLAENTFLSSDKVSAVRKPGVNVRGTLQTKEGAHGWLCTYL